MTIINPNSIAGITSVTAEAGVMNFYKSDGTLAGLQLNGVNFNTTAGVSTFNNLYVGGTITYEDVKNVDSVGIITARAGLNVTANIDTDTLNVSGISTFGGNVLLGDDDELKFGAGNDGFIKSDGSNFLFQGSGTTYVRGSTLRLSANGGSGGFNGAVTIDVSGDERVQLKYGSGTKLVTTNTGVTVTGTVVAGGIDCNGTLEVSSTSNFDSTVKIADKIEHLGDSNTNIRFPAADTVAVETGGSEALRITSDGSVGIGTDDASWGLSGAGGLVVGDGSASQAITLYATSNGDISFGDAKSGTARYSGLIRYNHTNDYMAFRTATQERARIDSDGNVGINTTLKSIAGMTKYLSVSARNVTNGGAALELVGARTGSDSTLGVINFVNETSNVAQITAKYQGSTTSGSLQFFTSGSERLRITSSGVVEVKGAANDTALVQLQDNNIGGVRIAVNDESISAAIYLPRDGAMVLITGFSNPDTSGTNYPQPSVSGMVYIDCGPSRNIQVCDLGSNVCHNIVAKNAYTGTVGDCDNNKLTVMSGDTEGTFRLVNRIGSTKYLFTITML